MFLTQSKTQEHYVPVQQYIRLQNLFTYDGVYNPANVCHAWLYLEAQTGGDGGGDLADDGVEVAVGRSLHAQLAAADVVDGLVVNHEGAVAQVQCGVRCQDRVVRLHNRTCNLQIR